MLPAGAPFLIREVLHGRTWIELPATVVADDDVLALRVDPGAPFRFPAHPFGPHPWSGAATWSGTTVLRLYREGLAYSVWRMFPAGEPSGWYVNFERPILRAVDSVAIDDWGLDIVIDESGAWRWKDPGDPADMVASGRLAIVDFRRLRSEADAVRDLLRSGGPRWWERFADWRPTSGR